MNFTTKYTNKDKVFIVVDGAAVQGEVRCVTIKQDDLDKTPSIHYKVEFKGIKPMYTYATLQTVEVLEPNIFGTSDDLIDSIKASLKTFIPAKAVSSPNGVQPVAPLVQEAQPVIDLDDEDGYGAFGSGGM